MREAGLQSAAGTQIQVRVNGVNGAFGSTDSSCLAPIYGWNLITASFLTTTCQRLRRQYLQEGPAARQLGISKRQLQQYMSDGWSKSTNASENNWSDLNNLFRVMNQTPPGPNYYHVSQVANVDQWVRWFAAMELLNSQETNLSNGSDDDYQMFVVSMTRVSLLPHDLDTILGQGDTGSSATDPFFGP